MARLVMIVFQRFLSSSPKTGTDLWLVVKPYVRQVQSEVGVIIVDNSISGKPHIDENEIICWHYHHTSGQTIKGINSISALYHAKEVSLPVNYRLIEKTETYIDKKTGKEKRRSPITKNEIYCQLLQEVCRNQIPFRYVVNDVWFASANNIMFIVHDLKHHFVMPVKTHHKLVLSLEDKKNGRYVRVDELPIEAHTEMTIYLESVNFALKLVKYVFTNADGSIGILYLVSSDLDLTYVQMTTVYQKRWNLEPYHKSLKQNAALSKSPTKTVTTQRNHFFASLCSYIELEMLKVKSKTNHFALKSNLYLQTLRTAFDAPFISYSLFLCLRNVSYSFTTL